MKQFKKHEIQIRDYLNKVEFKDDNLKSNNDQFAHYDLFNENTIVEFKRRTMASTMYGDSFFEKRKYDFNIKDGRRFLYVVKFTDKTYVWDISKMDQNDFDFKWFKKSLPETTQFNRRQFVYKIVSCLTTKTGKKI